MMGAKRKHARNSKFTSQNAGEKKRQTYAPATIVVSLTKGSLLFMIKVITKYQSSHKCIS